MSDREVRLVDDLKQSQRARMALEAELAACRDQLVTRSRQVRELEQALGEQTRHVELAARQVRAVEALQARVAALEAENQVLKSRADQAAATISAMRERLAARAPTRSS